MFKIRMCIYTYEGYRKIRFFYKEMGMEQNWIIERELEEGVI